MAEVIQHIHRKKFQITGKEFNGKATQSASAGYNLFDSSDGKKTVFAVVFTTRIDWENGSSVEFEADAMNEFEKMTLPPDVQFLKDLAIDSLQKLGEKWTTHPDYYKLNLPKGAYIDFGSLDMQNITGVLTRYKNRSLQIVGQTTVAKKSIVTNPDSIPIEAIIRPRFGIGFTFDRQVDKNIMVFAVHTSCRIEYTEKARFEFEGYDGTIFNSAHEKPSESMLLSVIREALVRSNSLLRKEAKSKKATFYNNTLEMTFSENEIIKMLKADIADSYPTDK